MKSREFIYRAALCAVAGLCVDASFAATCARLEPQEILRCVNDRLEREFISHDGLMLDYAGEIPTAAEIADLKPNAMGWWSPIENGSMFTGEWLPALMAEGVARKALVERCVRGLIKMSEVSDVPGFIARGTGTDGKSHHPCGSNDQTDPWFFGLCEYCRWPHADPALKAKALKRLVFVARALEKNGWGVPCDGPFKGEDRGNLNAKAMPFWGKSRLLYSLKSLHGLTGDAHWSAVYESLKAEALAEIEAAGEIDKKAFSGCYTWGVWVYLSSVQALARLVELEENPQDRARMRKGLLRYAERVAPLMKDRTKYANTMERPFKYANWRTGYAWRVQKTQRDAEAVAHSGKRAILGTRKDYERSGMGIPLCAAAVCAISGEAKYKDEILATLRHYDYSTPNISEFFHAAVAAAAVVGGSPVVSPVSWPKADTAWMPGSVGVSVHWTAGLPRAAGPDTTFEEAVNGFNVPRFVDAIASVGARHLIFTTAHAYQMLPMPNAALDAIAPGRTTKRDLFGEILDACAAKGIRVIAYYNHSCNLGPKPESEWRGKGGYANRVYEWMKQCRYPFIEGGDAAAFASNYCAIVRDISRRYGPKISGWWFDSAWSVDSRGPCCDAIGSWQRAPGGKGWADAKGRVHAFPWADLVAAAKSGNPRAAVAVNAANGLHYQYEDFFDYCAGEVWKIDNPRKFSALPRPDIVDTRWACADDINWTFSRKRGFVPLYTNVNSFVDWTREQVASNRMVTFNVLIDRDGNLSPVLKELKPCFDLAVSRKGTSGTCGGVRAAVPFCAATDWMPGKVGAFAHYLPDAKTFADIERFDVKGLVAQLKSMRADYFVITLGQNSGYYCSPNETLETLAGYSPNARCAKRDVPAEIIAALRGTGIRFGLYLPCQPAARDDRMETKLGFPADANAGGRAHNRKFTPQGTANWAKVIETWSRRYGKDVSFWWFDGAYAWIGFNGEVAARYRAACRAGNPEVAIAFNAGVRYKGAEQWSDVWAGEENEPFDVLPKSRWAAPNLQWQVLTFLGKYWADPVCRFKDEPWCKWLSEVTAKGGCVTLDMHIDPATGLLEPAQVEQFRRVRPAPKGERYSAVERQVQTRFHFTIPGNGDPGDSNGAFWHNGRYHLMYLYKRADGYAWGHVSSTDLFNWKTHPDAIAKSEKSPGGCFSGGAFVDDDGKAYLSYWMLWGARGLGLAVGAGDFDTFANLQENPIIRSTHWGWTLDRDAKGNAVKYASADPSNIWKKDGRYYMLAGNLCLLNDNGRKLDSPEAMKGDCAYLFESSDLKTWRYRHPFYQRRVAESRATGWTDPDEDCMCPSFLPLSDVHGKPTGKHLLLFISHNRGCQYYIGRYDAKNDKFLPEKHGRMTWQDKSYFAPEALVDGRDRQLIWTWLLDNRKDEFKRFGQTGVYGLPRSVWLADDGMLGMAPAEEIKTLRCHERDFGFIDLAKGQIRQLDGFAGDCCEVELQLDEQSAKNFSLELKASPNSAEATVVRLDTERGELVFDASASNREPINDFCSHVAVERAPFRLKPGEALKLRIFIDGPVVEVCANDRQMITRRVYVSNAKSTAIRLRAVSGDLTQVKVKAWEMESPNR